MVRHGVEQGPALSGRGLLALLAAAAAAALAAGCGSASGETAGAFMTRILREELTGRWAAQWQELHPGHRRLITQAQYVACSRSGTAGLAGAHDVLTVRSVADRPIHVRGVPERTAKLVTIEERRPGDGTTTYRVHAVRDRGRWTWILGPAFLDAIAHGRCLDGTPLLH